MDSLSDKIVQCGSKCGIKCGLKCDIKCCLKCDIKCGSKCCLKCDSKQGRAQVAPTDWQTDCQMLSFTDTWVFVYSLMLLFVLVYSSYVAICICVSMLLCICVFACILYTVPMYLRQIDGRSLLSLTVGDTWHSQIAAAECVRWKKCVRWKVEKSKN